MTRAYQSRYVTARRACEASGESKCFARLPGRLARFSRFRFAVRSRPRGKGKPADGGMYTFYSVVIYPLRARDRVVLRREAHIERGNVRGRYVEYGVPARSTVVRTEIEIILTRGEAFPPPRLDFCAAISLPFFRWLLRYSFLRHN